MITIRNNQFRVRNRAVGAFTGMLLMTTLTSFTNAAQVKIEFGGFVTDVSDGLSILNGLTPNGKLTRFTGSFTYDTSIPNTGAGFGFYNNSNTQFQIQFGNGPIYQQGGLQSYNNVQLGNDRTDYGAPSFDGFYAYAQWDTSGIPNGPYDYSEIGISLQTQDLTALAGNSLPLSLDLSKFIDPDDLLGHTDPSIDKWSAGIEFHLVSDSLESSTDVYGIIDAASVPEASSTYGLGLLGVAALVAWRRRPGTAGVSPACARSARRAG